MFSLEEHFASERVPLAHPANKGKYNDMENMCREAGVILGITKDLQELSRSGNHVLEYALAYGVSLRAAACVSYDHG